MTDYQGIAAAALRSSDAVIGRWLPGGTMQGHEYLARNPTRADERPGSFSVNLDTGAWSDFATGDKGGDLLSLVAYLDGDSRQGPAADRLAEFLGLKVNGSNHGATVAAALLNQGTAAPVKPTPVGKDAWRALLPVPDDAPAPPARHPKLGTPAATWVYRDGEGRTLCLVLRFEQPDGGKEFRPLTYCEGSGGARSWRWQGPPDPRPLYGLDRLAAHPAATVVVCEGEKAADAAARLLPAPAFVTVASLNGAQSPGKSDWSPLTGRTVIVWPDADGPGAKYAAAVARLARSTDAAEVHVLDPAALRANPPAGWDAADALADGWTAEQLEPAKWAESANPYRTPEGTGGTEGIANNGAPSSDSGPGNREGTAGTARPKPPVNRPEFAVHEDFTGFGQPGLWWHGLKGGGEDAEPKEVDQWVCSPLHADAIAHGERDADYGLLLRFQNACGRWREWSMPMRLLKGSGEELRGELLDLGVRIDPASHRLLNAYLMSRHPKRRILAATATGWHCEGRIFVLPDRIIGSGDVRYQSEHAQHDAFSTGGTLGAWQRDIAARCRGNPMLEFAVSAALSGPLLAKVHRTGCGFHFVGDSSTGKSTLLNAGASCWGGAGFIRTWKATGNGLEGIAAALTDTALVLDEISEADPREIGSVVYSIGNGTGKSRGARTGGAKAVQRWRVVLLSSGERTLAATMAEGGKSAKAGQEARLLDIPCTRRLGVFDALHDQADGRAFSDTLRTAAAVHYGHAGPAFVARMIADPRDWGALHAQVAALPRFAAGTTIEGRSASAFALVALAGELAIEWGIVPWPEGEALDAAASAFDAWKANRPKGHTETRQILQAVGDFIAAHGDSRFSSLLQDSEARQPVTRDRAGWWRDTADGRVYLFTSGGLRAATASFDFRRVLEALDASGWIADRDDGRRSKKTKVQGRSQNLYAIAPTEAPE